MQYAPAAAKPTMPTRQVSAALFLLQTNSGCNVCGTYKRNGGIFCRCAGMWARRRGGERCAAEESEHVRGLLWLCLVLGSKRRWAAPVRLPNLQEEIIPSIVANCFVLSLSSSSLSVQSLAEQLLLLGVCFHCDPACTLFLRTCSYQ
jgi:hypothetical protein